MLSFTSALLGRVFCPAMKASIAIGISKKSASQPKKLPAERRCGAAAAGRACCLRRGG